MCVVVYSQFWPRLWGWKQAASVRRHANKISLGLIWGSLLAVVTVICIVAASQPADDHADGVSWAWIDVVLSPPTDPSQGCSR